MARTEEKIVVTGEDRASGAFNKAGGSFEGMAGKISKVATLAGIGLAADKLVDLAGASLKAAISAEEAASAFATTFGPAAQRAGVFVDEFANKAGFAEFQLEQLLATTGAVIQGLGGTQEQSAELALGMARLAGDVASFRDVAGGAAVPLQAMQSALTGEREALKTYGIVIGEAEVQELALATTRKRSAAALTTLEKAQATYNLMVQKSGPMLGDLDRTSGSVANTLRSLVGEAGDVAVKFGQAMLPAVEEALALTKQLTAEGHLLDRMLDELALSVGDTATDMGTWGRALAILEERLGGVGEANEETSRSFFDGIPLVRQATDALGWLIEKYDEQIEKQEAAANQADLLGQESDKLARNFRAAGGAAEDAGESMVDNFARPLPTIRNLTTELVLASEAGQNLQDTMLAAADPLFRAVDAWQSYQEAMGAAHEDNKVSAEEAIELLEKELRLAAAMGDLSPAAYEDAMLAIQLATGKSREEIQLLIDQVGFLDGQKAHVEITIEEVYKRGGARNPGGSFRDRFAFHEGGVVPDPYGGGPVPALLMPREIVFTPQGLDRLIANRDQSRQGGGDTFAFNITVNAAPGADGHQIGRQIEAALASSELLRKLPERIL